MCKICEQNIAAKAKKENKIAIGIQKTIGQPNMGFNQWQKYITNQVKKLKV